MQVGRGRECRQSPLAQALDQCAASTAATRGSRGGAGAAHLSWTLYDFSTATYQAAWRGLVPLNMLLV